jgi:hypothetical protein
LGNVTFVSPDLDLGPLGDWLAIFIDTQVHRPFFSALADRFYLSYFLGPSQEIAAPFKRLSKKIGPQAVA